MHAITLKITLVSGILSHSDAVTIDPIFVRHVILVCPQHALLQSDHQQVWSFFIKIIIPYIQLYRPLYT